MKHLIVFAFAALLAANLHAASPAATQAWVKNYVAGTTVQTRSVGDSMQFVAGTGLNTVTTTIERCTIYAIRATNVTAAAVALNVTNGMYFVWNDPIHSFTNHAEIITATPTNYVWHNIGSYGNTFSNYFEVANFRIQPSYAKEVTK